MTERTTRAGSKRAAVPHGAARRAALESISLMLSAGVDASSALTAAGRAVTSAGVRRRLREAGTSVQGGIPLWQALTDQGLLSAHQAWLVRAGEESGTLAEHMIAAVEHERREESFRRRLVSALLYPAIVVTIALVVGLGVAWFILPRLVTVFGSLRVELPVMTRALLGLGQFLSMNGYWAVPAALAAVVAAAYVLFVARRTRWVGQTLLLKTPGFGKLIREVEIARFGSVVGSLLDAGVPVPAALEALADSSAFHPYPALYKHLHVRVTAGQTIAEALAAWKGSARHIPPTVQEILTVAEQTGQLTSATKQVGSAYELRLEATTKDLISTIEPLVLFMVWLGVVGLAAAIITPIYSILRGVNQ